MMTKLLAKHSRFRLGDFIKATPVKTYKSKMSETAHGDASSANSHEFRKRMKKLDKKLMAARKTNQAQKCINEFSEIVRQYVLRFGHYPQLAERYRVVCEMFESRISSWIYNDCIRPDVWNIMTIIYHNSNNFQKAKDYRKETLRYLRRWLRRTEDVVCSKLEPGTARISEIDEIEYIIDAEKEHKKCMKILSILGQDDALHHHYDNLYFEWVYFWAGRLSLMAGQHDRAYREFRKGFQYTKKQVRLIDPNYRPKPIIYFYLAQCYENQKKYQEAREMYSKHIKKTLALRELSEINSENCHKVPESIYRSEISIGNISYATGDHDKAILQYEEFVKKVAGFALDHMKDECQPCNVVMFLDSFYQICKTRLIEHYNSLNDSESEFRYEDFTEDQLEDLLKVDDIVDLWTNFNKKNNVFERLNIMETCEMWLLVILKGKLKKFPYKKLFMYRYGYHLALGNEYEAFLDCIQTFSIDEPILSEEGKEEDDLLAIEDILGRVTKIGFKLKLYEETLAFLLDTMDRFQTANPEISIEEKGPLSIDETMLRFRFKIAECFYRMEDFKQAIKTFDGIIDTFSKDQKLATRIFIKTEDNSFVMKCIKMIGKCYIEVEEFEVALQYLDLSIKCKEDRNWSYLYKGKALIMLKRNQEAQEALLKSPNGISALILLIVNAKILSKPYKNFVKKVLKICQDSVEPLKKSIKVCPIAFLREFLDTLVYESKFEAKYTMFRSSCSLRFL